MNPKPAKSYLKEYSDKIGIPIEDVEILVNAYWRALKNSIEDVRHFRIRLLGIGRFFLSYKKFQKLIVNRKKEAKQVRSDSNIAKEYQHYLKVEDDYIQEYKRMKEFKDILKNKKTDKLPRPRGKS